MWYHLMYHRDNANLLVKFSSRRIAVKIGGLHCRSLESAKVDDVIVYREDFWENYRARWASFPCLLDFASSSLIEDKWKEKKSFQSRKGFNSLPA